MSDLEVSPTDARPRTPVTEPYQPFPTFAEWQLLNFDFVAVDSYLDRLAVVRESTDRDALLEAVRVASRWAAVNTGAIEGLFDVDRGFTYSVAVSGAALETIATVKGKTAAASISDAIAAYDFVLDAATGSYPLNEMWIRSLHEIVTQSQDSYTVLTELGPQEQELTKGRYKVYPNNPLHVDSNVVHSYAPPSDTAPEMRRLVDELRAENFLQAHPVIQAAYAHYAFVCIHPFADGNGRVSRALASTFLYRGPGIPLVIFADQKAAYLAALEEADAGDPSSFIRFIADRVMDSVGMIQAQMQAAKLPTVSSNLRALAPQLAGIGGIAHTEMDSLAVRVSVELETALNKVMLDEPLQPPLSASTNRYSESSGTISGYRQSPQTQTVRLTVMGQAPAQANTVQTAHVYIRRPDTEGADVLLTTAKKEVILEISTRDLHPTMSQALLFRLEATAQSLYRATATRATSDAMESLRKAGYV